MEELDFQVFIRKVKEVTKIDLSQYKEQQMKRRLTVLRAKNGYDTFVSFFEAMRKDPKLMDEFLDRMTINVSEFWRNPNRWEVLEKVLIPQMLRDNSTVKCWSAACSTGEEPYTVAMIFAEQQGLSKLRLLATDIDQGALAKARKGAYIERNVRDVPPHYLHKYFKREQEDYFIHEDLKRAIQFKHGNLLEDEFQRDFDLIVCRNVMIYFTEEAKQLLYHKFSAALKPGGLLFVGSTEQIFNPGVFNLEQAETFIYRRKQ